MPWIWIIVEHWEEQLTKAAIAYHVMPVATSKNYVQKL
jgi:hypothetical protein